MVFIEKDAADGLPYFSLVADIGNQIDLRSQIRRFTENDTTVFNLVVAGEWGDHPVGSYILYQDSIQDGPTGKYIVATGYPIAGIPNAAIFTFAPGLTLNPEYPVKLQMESTDGTKSTPNVINLFVGKKVSSQFNNVYDVTNLSSMQLIGSADADTSGSDISKIIPYNLSLKDVLEVPVEVSKSIDADGSTIKLLIGVSRQSDTKNLLTGDNDHEFKTLKDDILNAKESIMNTDKVFEKYDKLRDKGIKGQDIEWSKKTSCKVIGFAEIKLDKDDKIVKAVGGVIAKLDGTYTYGRTIPLGGFPVYYELKFGVGAELKFGVSAFEKDGNINVGLEGTATFLLPKVSLEAGLGVRGVLTVGVEGGASLKVEVGGKIILPAVELKPIFKGSIESYAAFKAKLLFVCSLEYKLNLPPATLWNISESNKQGTQAVARAMAFSAEVPEGLSYELSLVSRDYAEKTTAWSGTVFRSNPLSRDFNVAQDVIHEVQGWILPDSIPQIVKVGDKMIMLFQYDDKDRETGDNIILMYSIYNDGVWSERQPVWVSDTGDTFFNHVVVNDELYVVWQKQNTKVIPTEDALALLQKVSENSEIVFAKFNKVTGTFEDQFFVTNNTILDMYPTVAVNGEEISIVWVSNSDSDALGMSGTYSIMKSVYNGEVFSAPVTLFETEEFIAELSAGYVNGKLEVAFTAGDSADLTAAYIVDSTGASRFTGEGSVSALKFNNEHFYYHTLGSVYTYNPTTRIAQRIEIPDVFAVSSSYKIVDTDNKQALVWVNYNGDNYSIQASLRLDNGAWTLPITLLTVDDETVISYMDVVVSDSGTWNVIMNTALRDLFDVDEESDFGLIDRDELQKSSLVFAIITQKTDTELVYVYANQRDVVGGVQSVSFSVKNLGESVVESLRVDISSEDKSYFSEVISCYVEPGDAKDFTVNIDVSDLNGVTDLAVFVASVDELNTSNNIKSIQLGQVEVSIVDLIQYKIGDNVIVTAQIANTAKTPANNVVVKVIEDSLDGNVLDVKEIEVLDNTQDYVCIFKIDTSELVYDEFDRKVLFFQVETVEPNYHAYDNTEVVILYKEVEYEISDVPLEQIILVSVESVEIEVDVVELILDDPERSTAQLVATVLPKDASNQGVRWVVEDGDVVLVDSFGVVHALRVGETIVTAVTQDGGFMDTVKVVVTNSIVVCHQLDVVTGVGGKVSTGLSGEYVVGDVVELSAVAGEYYVFKQWVSSGGGVFDNAFSASTSFVMPDGDVVVTAVFGAAKEFNVCYDVDGVVTVGSVKFLGDTVTVLSDAPKKVGYVFVGWLYNGVVYRGGGTFVMPANDVVLVAQWSEIKYYSVVYDGNGFVGGGVPVDGRSPYVSGSVVLVQGAGDMERAGYIFMGWSSDSKATEATYKEDFTFNIFDNTVLYAVWQKEETPVTVPYTVHYYLHGTSTPVVATKMGSGIVGTVITETAPDVSGYTVVNSAFITATLNATGNTFIFYYTADASPSPSPEPSSNPSPSKTSTPTKTATPASSETTLPTDTAPPTSTPSAIDDDNESSSGWTFTNTVLAVAVVVAILIILGGCAFWRRRNR